LVYESRRPEENYNQFGEMFEPQAWGLRLGYSQLERRIGEEIDYLRTPSLYLVYAKPLSDNLKLGISGDGFYGVYSSQDNTDKVTLSPFGGGGGISYNNGILALGMNLEYHYPIFKYEGPLADEQFSGHAVSPVFGALLAFSNIKWSSALSYRWVKLNGSSDGNSIGSLKIKGYSAKSVFRMSSYFLRAAGFFEYHNNRPLYIDENDSIWFETGYSSYRFGGGLGISLTRLTAGFEGRYGRSESDDRVAGTVRRSSEYGVRIGAELEVVREFFLRGGYNYSEFDPDLENSNGTNDHTVTNILTCGFGINLFADSRIDFAYNYKQSHLMLTDERVTDHIFFIYLKRFLGLNEM